MENKNIRKHKNIFVPAKNNLAIERKKKGWTQKDFANELNQFLAKNGVKDAKPVSYATISRWENNEIDPKNFMWQILGVIFDVDSEYLQGRQKERKSPASEKIAIIKNIQFKNIDPEDASIIKNNLINIVSDIYFEFDDKIDHLQSQIDDINDPDRFRDDR